MAKRKTKLELTWIGKQRKPRLEPRILLEDPTLSYTASKRFSEGDLFDNLLIQGDNLLGLRALEADYSGKVACACIDPPYNTGSAFESYDDGLEHSIWLGLMRDRLEILRRLLSPSGSLWITLDDNEMHYLKILCDEVFGRRNYVGTIVWEKADSPRMDAKLLSFRHDYVMVVAKDVGLVRLGRLETGELPKHYDKRDADGRPYYLKPLRAMGGEDSREARPSMYFELIAPDGTEVYPVRQDGSDGRWRWGKDRVERDASDIEWVQGRDGWSVYYRVYAKGETTTRPVESIWTHEDVGSNRTSKAEIKKLFGGKVFDTPKPELLIERILSVTTDPGDIVLDSFLGSGTTAAVAHKMHRRWIGIEVLDHAESLAATRLRKVIDGDDPGGATDKCEWRGGGGFRFFRLAPSLLIKDAWGNWVISRSYNPEMLAEAMCKIEGFKYEPSPSCYWQHGQSTEQDFIYVTTQTLTHEQLQVLSAEVGTDRSLLICCSAFRADPDEFENLTITKIPAAVLSRCEWGRDDYSLNVESVLREELPPEQDEDATEGGEGVSRPTKRKRKPPAVQEMTLFGEEESQ